MNLVAIDTSTDWCGISFFYESECKILIEKSIPKKHSEFLPIFYQKIEKYKYFDKKSLDAIAVSIGPGSFTGTRLACSITQGLAYSIGIPVISVSSMQILAQGMNREFQCSEVIVLINAHMEQIYVGEFEFSEEKIISSSEKALNLDQINSIRPSQGSFFVGDGCQLVDEYLRKLDAKVHERHPNAKDLLREAEIRLSKGITLDPKDLSPVYLTGEEHWAKN